MNLAMERDESRSVIRLAGEANIGCAAELKTLLLKALASSREVFIDFEEAGGVDVSILQLILAAHREALQAGVSLASRGTLPAAAARVLEESGLAPFWRFGQGADAEPAEGMLASGVDRRP